MRFDRTRAFGRPGLGGPTLHCILFTTLSRGRSLTSSDTQRSNLSREGNGDASQKHRPDLLVAILNGLVTHPHCEIKATAREFKISPVTISTGAPLRRATNRLI